MEEQKNINNNLSKVSIISKEDQSDLNSKIHL